MNNPSEHLRFAEKISNDTPGLAFAPLVDIVLLLICFYLFVSKSIEDYEDATIDLPTIAHVQSLQEQPAEIVINLRADGDVHVNDQPITIELLGQHLQAQRNRLTRIGQPLIVVVRADRRQRFEVLDRVLSICRDVGVRHVSIRAVEQ